MLFSNPFCFTLSCFAAPLLYSSSSLPVVLSNLCMHNSIPIKDFCDTNVWATHCSNSMYSHSLSPLHAQVIMMLTLSWFSLFSLQIRVPKSELCTVCRRRVFPMESLIADKKNFHKSCFFCEHCRSKLR